MKAKGFLPFWTSAAAVTEIPTTNLFSPNLFYILSVGRHNNDKRPGWAGNRIPTWQIVTKKTVAQFTWFHPNNYKVHMFIIHFLSSLHQTSSRVRHPAKFCFWFGKTQNFVFSPNFSIFSVMRRYWTTRSESLTNTNEPTWLMWSWWVKVPTEAFTDETLAIDDTQGDYVKSGEWSAGHWGLQGGRWGGQHGSWQGGWHENTYWKLVLYSILIFVPNS